MHLQVYNVLLEFKKGTKITYHELSSLIRYDKSLRDKLYIYLATFEEKLRADLCSLWDVESVGGYRSSKKLIKDLVQKTNKENSNLYYSLDLDLGKLLDIYRVKKICSEDTLKVYEKIRKLRNKVMHHSHLLFGKAKTIEEAKINILNLTKEIENLYIGLPIDYRIGFENDINKLNYDNEFKPKHIKSCLCLGVFKNGICTKN